MKKVAIIGAGPMGLSLAFLLGGRCETCVYEADDRAGGMSASFDFDGFPIERYYHFVNRPDTYTFDLLKRLELPEVRWISTKMGIFRPDSNGRGGLQEWGNPIALLKFHGAPLLTRLRYGFHAFFCKFIKNLMPLDDVSAANWFKRWEGKQGYDIFWRFLFEKKFFQLADPLSAAWIASRIRRVANSRDSLMEEKLGYIEGGSQTLIDRLVERITEQGGEIRLSDPVINVKPGDLGRGHLVTSVSGVEHFDIVVSTIPLSYVGNIIQNLPQTYTERLDKILNVGCVCVLFRLNKAITENFWLNVDMPGWDTPGIIEYSNLRPTDHTYVYIPFYMPHDHPNWSKSDEELIAMARSYINGVNPEAAATEQAARLFRYQYAQPVCQPGFRHILPPYQTGIDSIFAADTTHSFPEDRSINESARIAGELADLIFAGV
jgi:protoporphyrinogen oxidase